MGRRFIVLVLCVTLTLSSPPLSAFDFGLSVEIASWGPVSLSVPIPVRGAAAIVGGLIVGGAALIAYFSDRGSSGSSYWASYPGAESLPPARRVTVRLEADDRIPGPALRARFPKAFDEWDRLALKKGFLRLQRDGRMVFEGAGFEGYAEIHADETFAVWEATGKPVVLLKPQHPRSKGLYILMERTVRARRVLSILGIDFEGLP